MRKAVYLVPGTDGKNYEFTLLPTSRKVKKGLREFLASYTGSVSGRVDAIRRMQDREIMLEESTNNPEIKVPDEVIIPEEMDETDFFLGIFGLITSGPHDKIDAEEFDIKIAEQAKTDFLPESARTTAALMEYFV